ncbi:uncharacterized protein LOC121864670 [Homarus americanus]|uniref:Death domain-containing protein n=1 Tax=Homarus americanus TaxID=6706 RepID=A0A8J5K808_HOMAM|nr:uncharacterized protein LOC121864670 [Homarus americanus]KAG7170367.1 hypothetical protein Hamer_G016184 [Homarus americanus]
MTYIDLKDEICNTWLRLTPEQMAQMRIALLEVSSSVGEFPRMREISRCADVSSALVLLERWRLLTPQKVDILQWLAEQVGPHTEMVRARIEQYKKLFLPPLNAHEDETYCFRFNPNTDPDPLPHHPVYDKMCEYLSENLRGRWADLGRSLGLTNLVSELFREQSIRQKDKIYQILEEYRRKELSDPITGVLRALERCSLNRQRNHIIKEIVTK